jgi:cellulose synthase/poly-beta-1,6-N-acetylglucosamine synthase-like glycosyltransferase
MFLRLFVKQKHEITEEKLSVTVIIAVWNEGLRIKDAVESILNSDYPKEKFKITVIGGGDDNTAEVCKELEKNGKIKFLEEKERRGKWFALNHAIKTVKTEAVAFTDGDCIVDRNWLKELVKYSKGVDIVGGHVLALTHKTFLAKMYAHYFILSNNLDLVLSLFFDGQNFSGQNLLVKRNVFKKINFRKSLAEDMSFIIDAKNLGFKLIKVPEAIVYSAVPSSLKDMHVQCLRILTGLYSDIGKGADVFHYSVLILSLLSVISWPFTVYYLFKLDMLTLYSISFLLGSLLAFYTGIKLKFKIKIIRYLPYALPMYVLLCVLSIEAIIKILLKREVEWKILNKVVD